MQTQPTQTHHREPELDVVLSCARLQLTDAQRTELRERLAAGLNSRRLLELAHHHRLVPLIHQHLTTIGNDAVPPTLLAALRQARQQLTLRALAQLSMQRKVVKALIAAEIPVMPLKGIIQARQLYGHMELRPSRDVDLLVPRHQVCATIKVLAQVGYRVAAPYERVDWRSRIGRDLLNNQCELMMLGAKPTDPVIEVHWSLRPELRSIDADAVWRDAIPLEFDGLPVHSLSPEWLLMFLCYHGCSHLFGRLHWLCDIGIAATTFTAWEGADRLAQRTGIAPTLGAAALASHHLLGTPLPPVSAATLQQGERLAAQIEENLHRPTPAVCISGWPRFRLIAHTHGGGLRGLSITLRQSLSPTPEEFELLDYSDRRVALAYWLRSARLAGRCLRALSPAALRGREQ